MNRLELLGASLDAGVPVWRFRDDATGRRVTLHGAARFRKIDRDVIRSNDPRHPLACEFRYFVDPSNVDVASGSIVER